MPRFGLPTQLVARSTSGVLPSIGMFMKALFEGVCTALVTPMRKGEVDYKALGELIEHQISGGVSALLVLGTTGEAPAISEPERAEIVRFCVEKIARRTPLFVGIGGNNLGTVIRYGEMARDAGADGVLVTAPYYNKATQDGVVKWFADIGRAVQLPIMAYNVPGRVGMNIAPETMARIAAQKWVRGIKESSGDMAQIAEVIRLCPKIAVYCGDDGLSLPCYATGARGVVSVASNARPSVTARLWNLFSEGRVREARKLFMEQLPFYKALFVEVNPIPIKYVMAQLGLCSAECRPPMTPLSDDNKIILDKCI